MVLEKFTKIKSKDPNFFYSYTTKEYGMFTDPFCIFCKFWIRNIIFIMNVYVQFILQGLLQHLIWADSRSIDDYKNYEKVVTFNTTYNTYWYKLMFGMFCGVNNHLKSILFAYEVFYNEVVNSFLRLFKQFRQCMGQHQKLLS